MDDKTQISKVIPKKELLISLEKLKCIRISDELVNKIKKMDDDSFILVKKEIKNGIIIHSVEEVTEELIEKALG